MGMVVEVRKGTWDSGKTPASFAVFGIADINHCTGVPTESA